MVDSMSLWQFTACVDGWNKANGEDEKPDPPTPEELEEMKANSVMPHG